MADVGLAGDVETPVPAISRMSLRSMQPAHDAGAPAAGQSALDLVLARWQTSHEPAVSPFASYLP
jgi:hypothetical protein